MTRSLASGCYNGLYAPTNQSPTIRNNLFYSNTTAILADGMPVLDYNGFWLNGGDFNVPTGTSGRPTICWGSSSRGIRT